VKFRDEPPHSGIQISAIKPITGVAGLIFAVGVILIFVIGLPVAKWFLLFSVGGGLLAFVILRLTDRSR
jgi:hypothetical protein